MPRIAIIGAGPGGLTLARLLHVHRISAAVFEADAGPTARPQGGSLDLHTDSGLRALELAGLGADFRRLARYEDQAARVYDKAGSLLYDEVDPATARPPDGQLHAPGDRPEIDRGELRDLLLASLPDGTVRWGHKITRIEPRPDGSVDLGDDCFDLVVGADGTWSRVRPLLTDVKPTYSGVMFVELEIDDVDAMHPDLAATVGRGKIFALGDRKALIAQRNARSNLRIYAAREAPETWGRDTTPAALHAELRALFADWAPSLRGFLEHARGKALPLPLYELPIGHRWAPRRGLTLLGDAAHVMSPFAGEGVNNAMFDATELALAITTSSDLGAAVVAYEHAVFAHTVDSAQASADGLRLAISDDAAVQMAALMRSHTAGQ